LVYAYIGGAGGSPAFWKDMALKFRARTLGEVGIPVTSDMEVS
jgi:hypothetical protein